MLSHYEVSLFTRQIIMLNEMKDKYNIDLYKIEIIEIQINDLKKVLGHKI